MLREEKGKSSRETSMPTSFVFPTIQFTGVHLHLRYFHSNSRGAIRSIFDIGTRLWRRSCDFSLNRLHDKKDLQIPPSPDFAVTPALLTQTFTSFFKLLSSPGAQRKHTHLHSVMAAWPAFSLFIVHGQLQNLRDVWNKDQAPLRWREDQIYTGSRTHSTNTAHPCM